MPGYTVFGVTQDGQKPEDHNQDTIADNSQPDVAYVKE